MLSRVASAVYWMNRYIERAENYARFIEVNLHLTPDLPKGTIEQWDPLVATTGDQDTFTQRYGKATRTSVVDFLVADSSNPNSILSCVLAARENARSVRETISTDMWEHVNRFYLVVREAIPCLSSTQALQNFLAEVKATSQLLLGVTDATMSHGEGWHFARLGRLLERADKTSRILDVKYFILLPTASEVGTPLDIIQWSALLKSASALEMYGRRFGRITPEGVAEFLIRDPIFPRAIRYCLIKAEDSLHVVSGSELRAYHNIAEKRLGRLRADLDFMELAEGITRSLHEFLDDLQAHLNRVDDAIFETFFALRPVAGIMIEGDSQ